MSDIVIRAEGLGKKYVIGHQAERGRYLSLREALAKSAHRVMRTSADLVRGRPIVAGDEVEEFWALQDLTFEVRRGEVVGIIGRNGAGKSTLLKILSRITEPSEGRISVKGRMASLLEVGTGFHSELSGRENILLYGAILGMSRHEVRRKFDEIISFAGVEKFLDTPVKRYSSGMYVRLAFAVAAHLDADILVVDEVLAVGDIEFQKKCLGRMAGVARSGRTVFFVSHTMASVTRLCDRTLWLDSGRIVADGSATEIVRKYLSSGVTSARAKLWDATQAPSAEGISLLGVKLHQNHADASGAIDVGQELKIDFTLASEKRLPFLGWGFRILNQDGIIIVHSGYVANDVGGEHRRTFTVAATLPAHALNAGTYTLSAGADIPNVKVLFTVSEILSFTVYYPLGEYKSYRSAAWLGIAGPGLVEWAEQ